MSIDHATAKKILSYLPGTDNWFALIESSNLETLESALKCAKLDGQTTYVEKIQPYIDALKQKSTAIALTDESDDMDTAGEELILSPDETSRLTGTALMHEAIGRRKILNSLSKLLTVTSLLEIKNIKETKKYKGLTVVDSNGKLLTVRTFQQYCENVQGRSLASIDNDLANLNELGTSFVSDMQTIGIGPATMRRLRQIPAEDRTELEKLAQEKDKDEFMEAAEVLIDKYRNAKDKLKSRIESTEAELAASRQRVEKYRNQVDELETERDKRNAKPPTPNEETERLKLELTRFCEREKRAVSAAIRSFTKQLIEHTDSMGQDQRNFVAGLFCDIEIEFAHLRIDFQIPERPSRDAVPEWMTPKEDAQS